MKIGKDKVKGMTQEEIDFPYGEDSENNDSITPNDVVDGIEKIGCTGSGQETKHYFIFQNGRVIGEKAIRKDAFSGKILLRKEMMY